MPTFVQGHRWCRPVRSGNPGAGGNLKIQGPRSTEDKIRKLWKSKAHGHPRESSKLTKIWKLGVYAHRRLQKSENLRSMAAVTGNRVEGGEREKE
ncbi:hypothetical protein NL676_001456 [Syzygium grande]|nr:hypothetical protein NL676_001456 [Syzygium grande]